MYTRNTAAVVTIQEDINTEFHGLGFHAVVSRKRRSVAFTLVDKSTGQTVGWVNVLNSELNNDDTQELSVFVVNELKEVSAY